MSDMATSDLMTRLRSETRQAHSVAESSPLEQALVQGTLPKAVFVRYLEQRLIVHRELEGAVATWCGVDRRTPGLVLDEQLQSPNLAADLATFGGAVEDVRPLRATSACVTFVRGIAGRPAVLGAFYVLEGSKNGARYIARAIGRAYGFRDGSGLRYLDPHGERQMALWQEFKARANAIVFAAEECDAIVAAARDTFTAIHAIDMELWQATQTGSAAIVGATA
ncbi:MAG: hypothetical protein CHACPFDD_02120 [Phycisphaerae bacterium]|nr:hypothetical protein [Phycisphaerae bacterium]